MKIIKRIIGVISLVGLLIVCVLPAFALTGNGVATIDKAKKGEQYNFYRILDLDYVTGTGEADSGAQFSYTINSKYVEFFESLFPSNGTYIDKDDENRVKNFFNEDGTPSSVAAFYYIKETPHNDAPQIGGYRQLENR